MNKKIWSLLLCLCMVLAMVSLSGCRDDAPDGSLSDGQENTVDTTENDPGDPMDDDKQYDADGNLILEKILDVDGSYIGKREYTYENGLRMTETEYDSQDTLIVKYTYEYDAGVLVSRLAELFSDGIVDATEKAEYDAGRNIVKESFFDAAGTLWQIAEYSFDADGNPTGDKLYGYENGIVKNCISSNEDGHILSEEQYDENGEVFWSIRYEYLDGLRVKGVMLDGSSIEYLYDKEGNETGLIHYDPDGNVTEKIIHEEDQQQAE